jgi:hypothetical protein
MYVSYSQALRMIVRLGQPFRALFLAQQRGSEYKRIAADHNIIAQVKDIASVIDMTHASTLEILCTFFLSLGRTVFVCILTAPLLTRTSSYSYQRANQQQQQKAHWNCA